MAITCGTPCIVHMHMQVEYVCAHLQSVASLVRHIGMYDPMVSRDTFLQHMVLSKRERSFPLWQ